MIFTGAVIDEDLSVTDPDFQIASSVLYHQDLERFEENTKLSGNGEPSPLYMFVLHQSRMLAAILDLPGNNPIAMLESISGSSGLEHMRSIALQVIDKKPMKLRFTLDRGGVLRCTSADLGQDIPRLRSMDYFPSTLPNPDQIKEDSITWLVGICPVVTEAGFTTRHKTNMRKHYESAYENAPGAEGSYRMEVLIWNVQDQVMEGCLTTPYFWREGRWITPHAECGGNLGTTRKWALDRGLTSEGVVMRDEIRVGEIVVLSNGVRGFGFGKIVKI